MGYDAWGDVIINVFFSNKIFKNDNIDIVTNNEGFNYYRKKIKFKNVYKINEMILKLPLLLSHIARSLYCLSMFIWLINMILFMKLRLFSWFILPFFFKLISKKNNKTKIISPIFHIYKNILKRKSSNLNNIVGIIFQKISIFYCV